MCTFAALTIAMTMCAGSPLLLAERAQRKKRQELIQMYGERVGRRRDAAYCGR